MSKGIEPSKMAAVGAIALAIVCAGSTDAANADFSCSISATCCSASTTCQVSQTCSCSASCSSQQGSCSCSCSSGGSGGGSVQVKEAFAMPRVPLPLVLAALEHETKVSFVAPDEAEGLLVDLDVETQTLDSLAHHLGKQLNAVPVYHPADAAIEFVPLAEVGQREFSGRLLPPETLICAHFVDASPGGALRSIAQAIGIDIVVPPGLRGTVNGSFRDLSWSEAMDAVLSASGNKGRVVVSSNGLVRVEVS